MRLPKLIPGELTIRGRLIFWFLTISLVPCAILMAVVSAISAASLEKTVRRGLSVISQAKLDAIDIYTNERRADAAVIGHIPVVVQATKGLGGVIGRSGVDSPEYRAGSETARNFLSVAIDAYGYDNAYLFANDGTLLLRLKADIDVGPNLLQGPLRGSELADLFGRAKTLLQSVFADYQIYTGESQPLSFVAHPVLDENGLAVGVLVLQLSNDVIYGILNDYNGLGETGEVTAGLLNGDEITYVSPSRFDPDAAFRRKIKIGSDKGVPMQRAARGQRGFGLVADYRGQRVAAVSAYVPSFRWGLVVKQDYAEAYELITQQSLAVAGLMASTVLAVTLVALLVARNLSGPVRAVVDVADRVAAGDLTADVPFKAQGELGQLVRAIRKMTQDLRSLIGRVQKSSIALLSTATEIAATSKQQEQTVNDHGTSTNEAAAAVKEISATSQELLRTMNEVNHVAAQTAEMASHGQESLTGMDRTMRQLADSTASIGSKLSVISERAANINLVVTTITKVADQTNLLSINAAIEAEKAGEYGLGFLVVAREIRRLADQTAVSTLDIERMVKEMQYSVSAGVMEMDKFSDQVRQGVKEVAQLSEKLGQIIHAVQGLTEQFDHVTEGMRVQSQGADQIREAVVRISEGANLTLTSLREFNQATAHLREAVGGLKEEVSRFRVDSVATGPVLASAEGGTADAPAHLQGR
jgi:methyl-accepting chemotaxis protein WspA